MLNQQNIQHGVKHDYLHRGGNHDLFPYFSVVPCFVLTKTLIVNEKNTHLAWIITQ